MTVAVIAALANMHVSYVSFGFRWFLIDSFVCLVVKLMKRCQQSQKIDCFLMEFNDFYIKKFMLLGLAWENGQNVLKNCFHHRLITSTVIVMFIKIIKII